MADETDWHDMDPDEFLRDAPKYIRRNVKKDLNAIIRFILGKFPEFKAYARNMATPFSTCYELALVHAPVVISDSVGVLPVRSAIPLRTFVITPIRKKLDPMLFFLKSAGTFCLDCFFFIKKNNSFITLH
jgi:hypothetical protein